MYIVFTYLRSLSFSHANNSSSLIFSSCIRELCDWLPGIFTSSDWFTGLDVTASRDLGCIETGLSASAAKTSYSLFDVPPPPPPSKSDPEKEPQLELNGKLLNIENC